MTLRELLADVRTATTPPAVEVAGLDYDSRRIGPGAVFFAFAGDRVDGHDFVAAARRAGAAAVVSERPRPTDDPGPWIQVEQGRQALALAALTFYGRPDRRVRVVAITGTNGKTTTVYLIVSMLQAAGRRTARIGTIEHVVGEEVFPAINTTPESLDLARYLARLAALGGGDACMEVSSHALDLGRFYGFEVDTAVFTNLSRDHLDYHGDMETYARAKRRLVEGAGARPPRAAAISVDDPVGREFLMLPGFERWPFGLGRDATVTATDVRSDFEGLRFELRTPSGSSPLFSRLHGLFNVRNILGAAAAALALGASLAEIRQGVEALEAVPGRFETIREGQPYLVAVDYAHTDDALRNTIAAARELLPKGGRIVTLFGCGGDRDRAKRPLMGAAAGEASDFVVLTSDNPRHEDPLRILADAEVGLQRVAANYVREADRERAIARAFDAAQPGDIVLIAGRGHEPYQKIGDREIPFNDREVARRLLRQRRAGRTLG